MPVTTIDELEFKGYCRATPPLPVQAEFVSRPDYSEDFKAGMQHGYKQALDDVKAELEKLQDRKKI